MSFTIDKEEIKRIAKEIGLEVKLNSDSPGVKCSSGKVFSLEYCLQDYLKIVGVEEGDKEHHV